MTNKIENGASVVISHHVRDDKVNLYEEWLNEISTVAKLSSGLLDWQIVRPIKGITTKYTVILRFSSKEDLEKWMFSETRKSYIQKARTYFVDYDKYYIGSGLDFLFINNNSKSVIPKRWKQFLVTWSAIFPLSFFLPLGILPLLRMAGLPPHRWIDGLLISGTIVFVMIYIVMPRYTKLVHEWLNA